MGRSFLPRGTGIVTRRPLVLQLVYSPKDSKEHRSAEEGKLLLIQNSLDVEACDNFCTRYIEFLDVDSYSKLVRLWTQLYCMGLPFPHPDP